MAPAILSLTLILATLPNLLVFAQDPVRTCKTISSAISKSSAVFFPGSAEYANAISHWANSSSQQSTCAVEPGTTDDLSQIVKILGSTRTPFGVKSGGHASNPGFSSTKGVEISLAQFNQVEYDNATSTVRVGVGQPWDNVYSALERHGVITPGGRCSGVGVGGLATGGGISWKTNQVGLTVDLITACELVLPNGTIATITEASHPDLFFGIKGGFNNFGIVTSFTFKTVPQTQIWGGAIVYAADQFQAVASATQRFSVNNKDPKAQAVSEFTFANGALSVIVLLFYDAPILPKGIYDEFLAIPSTAQNIKTRSYLDFVQIQGVTGALDARAGFHTVSILEFSQGVVDAFVNETKFWGERLQGASIQYTAEPLLANYSRHATPSAYPHDTSLLPLLVSVSWNNASQDQVVINAMKESIQTIYEIALAEGQDIKIEDGKQIRYPNYALSDTPLEQLYGANVGKLRSLRAHYDPHGVMSLTGGFKF